MPNTAALSATVQIDAASKAKDLRVMIMHHQRNESRIKRLRVNKFQQSQEKLRSESFQFINYSGSQVLVKTNPRKA